MAPFRGVSLVPRGRWLALVVLASQLAACATTERQLLQSEIDLDTSAIVASQQTLTSLEANAGGPGSYQAKAYISSSVVNRALMSLNGFTMPVPGISNATAQFNSIQLLRYASFPAVLIDAAASRGSLKFAIKATAVLVPTGTPGDLKVSVLSFVPVVSWNWIEFTKSKFVRDLLSVEVNKLTDQMPLLHLPTEGAWMVGGPAFNTSVTFQATPRPAYITMQVNVPATQSQVQLGNVRYYFLGQGIYMFGNAP